MGATPSVQKDNQRPDRPVCLAELLPSLNTGDVVLFCGNGFRATVERWLTWSEYSHVGMVQLRQFPGMPHPTVCLWESVGHLDELPCLLHGRRKTGVRLVTLEDKVNEYIRESPWSEVRLCVVPMCSRGPDGRAVMDRHLTDYVHQCCGVAYPTHTMDILRAGFPGLAGDGPPVSGMTCNRLIAETLVRMHAYRKELPVGQITLNSFIDGTITDELQDHGVLDQVNYHWVVKPPVFHA